MPSKQKEKPKDSSAISFSQLSKQKTGRGGPSSSNAVTKQKPFKPLLSVLFEQVSKPPLFDLPAKGKAKAKTRPEVISLLDDSDGEVVTQTDDRLWVDIYEPQSEAELAVHKRKVEDVRRWFQEAFEGGPTGKLKKYRRILVLTGSAGTAKTTTVRVLSKELGFDILEWRNSLEESYQEDDYDRESLTQKFETFLARASACRPLLGGLSSSSSSSQAHLPTSSTSSSTATISSSQTRQRVVLLEDLPNILHQPTQEAFHNALEALVTTAQGTPLVIIISDASTRGEVRDEKLAQGGSGHWSSRDTVDIRTVLPASLISGPYVTQIAFNPIAPTLMHRALHEMLARHYAALDIPHNKRQAKDELNVIVETSHGDIRSAVMALQFSCVLDGPKGKQARGKKKGSRALMEAVTRREQALALFHLMGKVLYNKRKGDPITTTLSAKDKHRIEEIDARLRTPPPLPSWLNDHQRRASRVDVDSLYAESPIDTGLFSLYIHQNYPQFCNDVDEGAELTDWLSWIDSSGGEQWYQTNPHQFHLLTLGTLHSLPSPVTRRGQKMYKPEFFDVLRKTREAEDALSEIWTWLQDSGSARWSREDVVIEMGAVLKARTRDNASGSLKDNNDTPPSHSAFSRLVFTLSSSSKTPTLDADGDGMEETDVPIEENFPRHSEGKIFKEEDEGHGCLSDDDIEEF